MPHKSPDFKRLLQYTPIELSQHWSFLPDNDKPPHITDENNGKWFADTFAGWLCYNTTAKRWYWYDGIKWNEDETKEAEKAAVLFSKAVYHFAAEQDSSYKKEVVKLQQLNVRKNMLTDAQTHLSRSGREFDARPNLLNCICGTFNTDTLKWQYHDHNDLLTKCANVTEQIDLTDLPKDYSRDFEAFMLQIQPKERVDFLQQIFGLCLTENIQNEKFFICHGPKTRNGKSSLLDAISQMLGSYATMVNPETFSTSRHRNGSGPTPDRADIRAARLLHVPEFPKGTLLDSSFMKQLTGGDTIKARHLQQENIEFKLTGQIIFNTNHLPAVSDVTLFKSNRVVVIPFEKHFTEEEQDFTLKERLKAPEMSNQVFYWCLNGLIAYRASGRLKLPQSVQTAVEEYGFQSDKVARFMKDATESAPGCIVKAKDLYGAYMKWCGSNGANYESKQVFFDELRRKDLMCKSGTVNGMTIANVVKDRRLLSDYEPLP